MVRPIRLFVTRGPCPPELRGHRFRSESPTDRNRSERKMSRSRSRRRSRPGPLAVERVHRRGRGGGAKPSWESTACGTSSREGDWGRGRGSHVGTARVRVGGRPPSRGRATEQHHGADLTVALNEAAFLSAHRERSGENIRARVSGVSVEASRVQSDSPGIGSEDHGISGSCRCFRVGGLEEGQPSRGRRGPAMYTTASSRIPSGKGILGSGQESGVSSSARTRATRLKAVEWPSATLRRWCLPSRRAASETLAIPRTNLTLFQKFLIGLEGAILAVGAVLE